MSTDVLSLNGIVSLKGLSSAKILKEELPIPTDPVNAPNEEVKKCLLEMSEQIIDFQNDEGGSKKLVVLEKPKENEIEEEWEPCAEVDDDTTLATISLPPIGRPGLFNRITSVFTRRTQHFSPSSAHSFAEHTAPVETSKEDVYWTSFESVPDVDEKTLADITNLALRDKTIKKDEETLSKLLKLYIKHGHNNLVRSVLDDMMINSYPVDGKDSDEMTPLTYAMLSNNTEGAYLLLNAGADPNRICSISLKDFIIPFLKNNRELIHKLVSVIKKPFKESFLQNKEELRKSFEINKDKIIEILSVNEDKLKFLHLSKEEILKTLENDIEEGTFHFDLLIDFAPFFLEKILDQWPDRWVKIPVSPINLAILMGNLDIANELINKKADITSSFAGIPFSSPIHLASLLGSDHFVSLLLKNRVDVNLTGPIGETPLITAVLRGKASLVELLLHSNPNVAQLVDLNHLPLSETETVDIKFNALTLALAFGKEEIIKLLENRGAKIEEALQNNTAKVFSLFINLLRDDKDGFEFLLKNGVDINTQGILGINVFHLLILFCSKMSSSSLPLSLPETNETIIQYLTAIISKILEEGKDLPKDIFPKIISSILLLGIRKLNSSGDSNNVLKEMFEKRMQALLDRGADPRQRAGIVGSNLMPAVQENNIELVGKLLALGVDVNIPDHDGATPLMAAVINSNVEMVDFLLKNVEDIDVNCQDSNGLTPLQSTLILMTNKIEGFEEADSEYDDRKKIVSLLLEKGAVVSVDDLIPFVTNNDNDIVALLLEYMKDPNLDGMIQLTEDAFSYDPMFHGSENLSDRKKTTILTLIENGASIDEQDEQGETLLIRAAKNCQKQMVKFLLEECKANPNIAKSVSCTGATTALTLARDRHYTEIVRSLLGHGANNYRALSIMRSQFDRDNKMRILKSVSVLFLSAFIYRIRKSFL